MVGKVPLSVQVSVIAAFLTQDFQPVGHFKHTYGAFSVAAETTVLGAKAEYPSVQVAVQVPIN